MCLHFHRPPLLFVFCSSGNHDNPQSVLGAVWGGTVEIPSWIRPWKLPQREGRVCEAGGLHAFLHRWVEVIITSREILKGPLKGNITSLWKICGVFYPQVLVCVSEKVWLVWSSSLSRWLCWGGSSSSGPRMQESRTSLLFLERPRPPNLIPWRSNSETMNKIKLVKAALINIFLYERWIKLTVNVLLPEPGVMIIIVWYIIYQFSFVVNTKLINCITY